jgi:hypothetical protein
MSPVASTRTWGRRLQTIAVFLALGALGAACGGDGRFATLRPNPTYTFELESRENALPREFPSEFPLPSGRTVLYSAVSPLGVVAYFSSSLRGEALRDFMLARLPGAGWRVGSCSLAQRTPESVWIIGAGKGDRVATVTVGFNPDLAARLNGRRYSFFVSVAERGTPPTSTVTSCREVPAPPPG